MGNSPARVGIDVGSVIADTYTIEGLIGKGGMGTVFLASHNRLPGKVVAIKLLHTDLQDDEILARFRRPDPQPVPPLLLDRSIVLPPQRLLESDLLEVLASADDGSDADAAGALRVRITQSVTRTLGPDYAPAAAGR